MAFGARMLKTGLAVTLTLYFNSFFLHFPSPVISAVAAMFAIQPTIYRSWRHFLEQLQANTLGAVLAMLAGMYFSKDPFAIGLICIIVIMICLKLKMQDSIGLTLVTVIAVMEASGQWEFALSRFAQILVGIGTASLINIFFLPPRPREQFVAQIQSVFTKLSLLLRTAISNEIKENIFRDEKKALEDSLKSLADKFKLVEEEYKSLRGNHFGKIRDLVVYQQMLVALRKGADVLDAVEEHYFQTDRDSRPDSEFDRHLETLCKFHEHVLLKFDEKLKETDPPEAELMEAKSARFLRDMMGSVHTREEDELRISIVASSMFEYSYHIARLDKLVEQYHRGEEKK
ncbi:Aromatic acid exporter family member 1 [Paenibacillus sp. UNCCL117]|uniref:FUSC family protein n=1 Tax=unclassified Paenibacillus TaxID=185978 RepID=UPI0008849F69|nr:MULTISPECIES: aromatic acid exporter family protein [unclassified Paenibacillus]SDC16062.1 Aromatic acid exporter family member 1 [Paenibacillus sp. cl123]SFW17686.1 Aromatic acid exporter family member 1 [Paenibacillus sp. UNCCL117]